MSLRPLEQNVTSRRTLLTKNCPPTARDLPAFAVLGALLPEAKPLEQGDALFCSKSKQKLLNGQEFTQGVDHLNVQGLAHHLLTVGNCRAAAALVCGSQTSGVW